jgi:hypothetical protein
MTELAPGVQDHDRIDHQDHDRIDPRTMTELAPGPWKNWIQNHDRIDSKTMTELTPGPWQNWPRTTIEFTPRPWQNWLPRPWQNWPQDHDRIDPIAVILIVLLYSTKTLIVNSWTLLPVITSPKKGRKFFSQTCTDAFFSASQRLHRSDLTL